jgi:hypothetical protein
VEASRSALIKNANAISWGLVFVREQITERAGRSSKSPWPLIRRLHEERFGPIAD